MFNLIFARYKYIYITNMKCLIFDTETTGLPPKIRNQDIKDNLEDWPYLMQLTFIIYDLDTMRVESRLRTHPLLGN